ncbi:MAG TPA: response regulator [Schlesneria sp.]
MHARRNKLVYIVDDDDSVLDSTQELLKSIGIEVRAFVSGGDLLEKFDPSAGSCIILDLHMPDISGLQVLDILRARNVTLPVILYSGRADLGSEAFAERSEVVALLAKPIDQDELAALVQRLVTQSPLRSRAVRARAGDRQLY